jgi:hypothetical protein
VLAPWIFLAEGGLGIDFLTIFGWHALMMSLAVIVLQESILTPRNAWFKSCKTKVNTKWVHSFLNILMFICITGGLIAIVQYKYLSPQPVVYPFYIMYSPHSWLAIVFLILLGGQVFLGIGTHMLTVIPEREYHKFLGIASYTIGLVVCCLGLQDMQSSDLAGSAPLGTNTTGFTQSELDDMGYFPNSTNAQLSCIAVILLVLNGLSTIYCLTMNTKPKMQVVT